MSYAQQLWDAFDWATGGLLRGRSHLEQHIAVFGESGSGKTTLLSAFYGWQQEPKFREKAGYGLNAADTTTGQKLRQAFLKMSDDLLPPPTRRSHEEVVFNIRVRDIETSPGKLVWHDYPGGWWTETHQGEEHNRKIETFKSLLQSDVALILCDGARLKKDGKKYIKGLIQSFRDELERQKQELVRKDEKLSAFPRIWIMCLSKADLFPDKDVCWFRDEVTKAAVDELDEMRKIIGTMIPEGKMTSLGEDFLLLSSAKFDPNTGKVTNAHQQVGLDLIMPLAIAMPVKRMLTWKKLYTGGTATVQRTALIMKTLTTNWMKYIPFIGNVFWALDDVAEGAVQKLKDIEKAARSRGDAVETVVAALAARLYDDNTKKVYYSSADVSR